MQYRTNKTFYIILDQLASNKKEGIKQEKLEEKEAIVKSKQEKGFFDNPIVKAAGRTAVTILTRSLLGALGLGARSKSKRIF